MVYLLVVALTILYYKRALKPFSDSLNELAKLAGSPKNYAIDDPKLLSLQVTEIKDTLDKHLALIEAEKHKLKTILDVMKTGVLVMDNKNVIHANKTVIDYFHLDNIQALELFINAHIKEDVALDIPNSFIKTIHQKDYLFDIVPYQSKWLQYGAIITVTDITDELKLEKTKKEFFQNASHELKSPLTVIKGNLEMITQGIIKDDINETLYKTIAEIDLMNALINQMLDVSLLESIETKQPQTYFIKDVIEQVVSNYDVKRLEKAITISLDLDDSTAFIEEKHLHMIITNLLDNAIKYNKKHGTIDIHLSHQKLMIKDSGLGIDKAEINRIYERFYRSSNESIKRISGSGLGLAIVKHIAQTYDIAIHLDSQLNKGTTFTLIFPK